MCQIRRRIELCIREIILTTIPHDKLKSRLVQIIDNCFLNKNESGNTNFSWFLGKQDTYFVRHHSDCSCKYPEADNNSMLRFLADNIKVSLETKPSNNLLVFLWALTVLHYWHTYFYIHMKQNLFRNCYGIKKSLQCLSTIHNISIMPYQSTIIIFIKFYVHLLMLTLMADWSVMTLTLHS
jgi:hypothetical protein